MSLVERLPNPVQEARHQLEQMKPQFEAALPEHISAERFTRVVMTAVQNNPELLECDRRSLWNACMKCAQDGLLPDGREAVIVVRRSGGGKTANHQPMIAGIRKKARNSGDIATWDAHIVCAGDHFQFQLGDAPQINHTYDLTTTRGPIIGAYSVCLLKDGSKSYEVMSIDEIHAIRDRTDAWRAFKSNRIKSTPWATDEGEMCRKTVARRHSKVLPTSTDLDDLLRRSDDPADLNPAVDASKDRPATLAGRLDALAAMPKAANPAEEQDAAAEAPQDEPQDETSEDAGVDGADHGQATQEAPEPHDEASYKAFAEAHIAAETNADLLPGWFTGDQQTALRKKCGVQQPLFAAIQAAVKARVTTLRAGKR